MGWKVWGSNRAGAKGFSFRNVQTASGAYPAYISTCTDVLSSLPRENRSGRKFDHIFPSTAEFKNDGSHTSTPPIHLDVADGENYFFYLVLYGKTVPAGAVGPLVKRTVIGICAFLSTNL